MMEIVSIADFEKMESLSPLDILAIVAEKAYEKDYSSSIKPTINMPMFEKKKLPFNLNMKPRPSPIDVHALFPCPHPTPMLNHSSNSCKSVSTRVLKKRRLIAPPPKPESELPVEYKHKIAEMGGSDVRFVIEKKLYDADVCTKKSRLTMPYRQCRVEFGKVGKTQVKLIHMCESDSKLSEMMMTFYRWDTVSSYVFNGSWNCLVEVNGLKKDDVVQVWSFRQSHELAFALLKL